MYLACGGEFETDFIFCSGGIRAGFFSCLGKGGVGRVVGEYFRQRQGFAFLSKRLTQKGLQKSLEGVIDISLYGKNTGNSDWLKLKIRPG